MRYSGSLHSILDITHKKLEKKKRTKKENPYIPCREIRDIRELTRTHVKFTQTRTALKNKVHKILQRAGVRISGVLSDIFGKSGIIILNLS